MDAVVAVTVMEGSMQGSALLGGVNILHSAFPQDADQEYSTQGEGLVVGLVASSPGSPSSAILISHNMTFDPPKEKRTGQRSYMKLILRRRESLGTRLGVSSMSPSEVLRLEAGGSVW